MVARRSCSTARSHVSLESKIDLARRYATVAAPVLRGYLVKHDKHITGGCPASTSRLDELSVQLPLVSIERALNSPAWRRTWDISIGVCRERSERIPPVVVTH